MPSRGCPYNAVIATGSFTTGAWYYRGLVEEGGIQQLEGKRCETPTAFANFPGEALYQAPPRSFAERVRALWTASCMAARWKSGDSTPWSRPRVTRSPMM